jgi:hypothetical protein
MTAEAAPEGGAPDPTRAVRATFTGLGAVIAPTSAVTALLYYYGWTRSSVEARRLGLDDSLLGYSTQDYLLRSMSSMLAPLVVALMVVLVALAFHALVLARVGRDADPAGAPKLLSRLAVAAAALGGVAMVLAVVSDREKNPSRSAYLVTPLAVTAGIVLLAYGGALYRRAFAARHPGHTWGTPRSYDGLVVGAIVMLLMVSLFVDAGRYAVVKGNQLADRVEAEVPRLPGAIVYSQKRLYLQPPVVETRLDPENAAYNYAYSGLKLLFRADDRYFLRPAAAGARLNIILPEGLDMRVELFPDDRPR